MWHTVATDTARVFFSFQKAFFWRGKDSIRTPLNYPWPPFPIQSWKDCHAYAVDAVERISPTLAENLRAMQREGRLLWVDSPGVVCDMFNAGQEAGQFLLLRFRVRCIS